MNHERRISRTSVMEGAQEKQLFIVSEAVEQEV